jgi:hypothetical protein
LRSTQPSRKTFKGAVVKVVSENSIKIVPMEIEEDSFQCKTTKEWGKSVYCAECSSVKQMGIEVYLILYGYVQM